MEPSPDPQKQPDIQTEEVSADEIASLRGEMLRFAALQLRDAHQAEDAVQEAIVSALVPGKYSGRGSLKSWVFAILRNKIIDVIRHRTRHATEVFIEDDNSDLDDAFKGNGSWKKTQKPADWGHPETLLASEQFWLIFELCLHALPETTARVFMMREHLGMELKEVCQELDLSDSNAWVIMHRARMQLRKCLEVKYIHGELL